MDLSGSESGVGLTPLMLESFQYDVDNFML